MSEHNYNREIHELLVDYACALRNGNIPTFLKSLSREEGQSIDKSDQFWEAAKTVRIINSAGFGDKAIAADVGLFTSRVDVNIVTRSKKAKATKQNKHTGNFKLSDEKMSFEKQKQNSRQAKSTPKTQ